MSDVNTLCNCWLFIRLSYQLGVSSVDELRQVLGTDIDELQKKRDKTSKSEDSSKDKDDNGSANEIVYKDSSTFLKVFFNHVYFLVL